MMEQVHDIAADGYCFSCRHNPCWKRRGDAYRALLADTLVVIKQVEFGDHYDPDAGACPYCGEKGEHNPEGRRNYTTKGCLLADVKRRLLEVQG